MGSHLQALLNVRNHARPDLALALLLALQSLLPIYEATQVTFLPDDAYISLTYARNLAEGKGFIYNHPPATLGTTTPLWAILVALLARSWPWADVATLAVYVSTLSLIATAWSFALFRKPLRLSLPEALIIGMFSLTSFRYYLWGTEYALFQLLLISAIALSFSGRLFSAGATVGLLALTRGEGVLLGPVLFIATTLQHRVIGNPTLHTRITPGLRLAAGFALVWALWSLYAWREFGQLLPHTLDAKLAQGYQRLWPDRFAFSLLWESLNWCPAEPFLPAPIVTTIQWAFTIVGIGYAFHSRRPMLALLAWIVLYATGYSLLGVPATYSWYFVPVFWAASCFAGLGIAAVYCARPPIFGGNRRSRQLILAYSSAVLTGLLLMRWNGMLQPLENNRAFHYTQVIEWLENNSEGRGEIACREVGFLGYFTRYRIIDLSGLTTPEVLDMSDEERDLLREFKPRYYLMSTPYRREWHAKWFDAHGAVYKVSAEFPCIDPGVYIYLYERTPLAPSSLSSSS